MSEHGNDDFKLITGSMLTDADWNEINNLKTLYISGGPMALVARVSHLKLNEPARYVAVWGALFPASLKEAVKDAMAEHGIDDEDLRQLVREYQSPVRDQ